MNEIWLKTKDVAELENVSERAIRKRCAQGKYKMHESKSAKGTKEILIILEALPEDLQQKYHSKKAIEDLNIKLKHIPEKLRSVAIERFNILKAWEKYSNEKEMGSDQAIESFIRENLQNKITRGTLYRWKKTLNKEGISGLVPSWKNKKSAFESSHFSKEAQEFVSNFFLNQNRPSIAAIYYELEKMSKIKSWSIPSYETVKRFIKRIPKGTQILEREGNKSFNDKVIPSMHRDFSNLRVNQVWVSDHHQINIATLIKDGKKERIIFPWISAWMDLRSKKPTGWILSNQPNSDTINLSLREGILRFGIPEEGYIDNGKDYRSRQFMGGLKRFKIELDIGLMGGIYADLGIKPHFTIPYHAQSKPIERFFKRFDDQFAVHFRGYRGKNIQVRPEKLKEEIKKGNLLTFEQLREKIHNWLEFNYSKRPHRGLARISPDEVLEKSSWIKRTIQEDELILLMSAYPKKIKVQRDGIWFMNDWYWGEDIIPYFKQYVWVRYSENDPSKIYMMDESGRYIGVAHKTSKAYWGMEDKDYEHFNRMKKLTKQYYSSISSKLKGSPMTDTEREAIVSSVLPNQDRIFEPDVQEEPFKTKYGMMIEDAKRKEKKNKKIEEEINKFDQKYASMKIPTKDIEAETDKWALNYGRKIIDEITRKNTND